MKKLPLAIAAISALAISISILVYILHGDPGKTPPRTGAGNILMPLSMGGESHWVLPVTGGDMDQDSHDRIINIIVKLPLLSLLSESPDKLLREALDNIEPFKLEGIYMFKDSMGREFEFQINKSGHLRLPNVELMVNQLSSQEGSSSGSCLVSWTEIASLTRGHPLR